MKAIKGVLLSVAILASFAVFAETAKPSTDGKPKMNATRILENTGGHILNERVAKGKVVFLNVAGAVKREELNTVIEHIRDYMLLYQFDIVDKESMSEFGTGNSAFESARVKLEAGALVAIVSDAETPVMLTAPEDGWAVVNVAKVGRGLKTESAKQKFLAPRIRKVIMRALACSCNAGGSGYSGNLLSAVKLEAVDFADEYYPVDVMQRIFECLKERGVLPAREVTYRKACMEGWAPSPTNDVQKKVWEKVHQLPSKPIKIEYNEKRDKGK